MHSGSRCAAETFGGAECGPRPRLCCDAEKRVKAAFREEGLEDYQVPKDLPIEAIAREVQQSWQLKVCSEPDRD